nr:receptor-like protein kinase feronia [Quercus suber]
MKSRILATCPDAFPDDSTGEVVDRRLDLEIPQGIQQELPTYPYLVKTVNQSYSVLPCRRFSLVEIKTATNNFDDNLVIGQGRYGKVYQGFIDDRTMSVAIKDEQEGFLVYEFVVNGNLARHLYATNPDHNLVSWKRRLQICIGVACGLHCLQTRLKHTIIHHDVKLSNILLNEKWEVKFSDFGLYKMGPSSLSKAIIRIETNSIVGTCGYMAPEYAMNGVLTEKFDVYSFGVALLQLLSGRKPSKLVEQMNLGFEPRSSGNWELSDYTAGCARKPRLQCENNNQTTVKPDEFVMLSNVQLPVNPVSFESGSLEECKSTCLNSCSCTGYALNDYNCSIWIGDLINLQQLSANNHSARDFYVTVAASVLSPERNKRKLWIIVVLAISLTAISSAAFIWWMRVRKLKRKGEDLISFDFNNRSTQQGLVLKKEAEKGRNKEMELPLFSFSSVSAATNNFTASNKLGEGGFGPV